MGKRGMERDTGKTLEQRIQDAIILEQSKKEECFNNMITLSKVKEKSKVIVGFLSKDKPCDIRCPHCKINIDGMDIADCTIYLPNLNGYQRKLLLCKECHLPIELLFKMPSY